MLETTITHPDRERIVLVDGTNQFLRLLKNSVILKNGVDIGGAITFFFYLRRLVMTFKPNKVYVVFDGENSTYLRKQLFPGYKEGVKGLKKYRHYTDGEIDNEIEIQTYLLYQLLSELPVKLVQLPYCESDDVIGYIVKNVSILFKTFPGEEKDKNVLPSSPTPLFISTTDSDYRQLLSCSHQHIQVYIADPIKGIIDREWVKKNELTRPENYVLKKALLGDKSDGIPGFIGKKTFEHTLSSYFLSSHITLQELIEAEFKKVENVRVKLPKRVHTAYRKCLDKVEQIKCNETLIEIPFKKLNTNTFLKLSDIVDDNEYPRELNTMNFLRKISTIRFDDEHLQSKSNWLRYCEDFMLLTLKGRRKG